jgi:hypothetical protein
MRLQNFPRINQASGKTRGPVEVGRNGSDASELRQSQIRKNMLTAQDIGANRKRNAVTLVTT